MKQIKNNTEQGSAHVVLVICLVVALLFALGWIFWQNFVQKQPVDNTNNTANTSNTAPVEAIEEPPKTTEIQLASEKLFLTIPASWKADIQAVEATEYVPARDEGSIKNASGVAVLNVSSGISGLGGACDPEMKNALTIVEVTKTKAVTSPDDADIFSSEVYAVKSYYYDPEKGYAAFVFLTNSKEAETRGVYKTCLPELTALFSGRNVQGLVSVTTTGGFADGGKQNMKFEQTKDQALTTLDSDDMKQAYAILQTARY